jgi:hypothetical protein
MQTASSSVSTLNPVLRNADRDTIRDPVLFDPLDLDPGSGAFLTPGTVSGIWNNFFLIPDHQHLFLRAWSMGANYEINGLQ